jgi:protein-S-isoprenylcysteine O-methyltransferase Ste14
MERFRIYAGLCFLVSFVLFAFLLVNMRLNILEISSWWRATIQIIGALLISAGGLFMIWGGRKMAEKAESDRAN